MVILYPLIFLAALIVAIHSSFFVRMMIDSMDDREDWSDQDKYSYALFVMIGLGVGDILGSMVFGRITDRCTTKNTIYINMLTCTLGFSCLILYGAVYDFSFYLGVLMTFSWGVQDSGLMCLLHSILGFQFKSKTTPFSAYIFLHAVLIFACISLEIGVKNQRSYLIYFAICYAMSMTAWFILLRYFEFKT